jgi:hypothetical protein
MNLLKKTILVKKAKKKLLPIMLRQKRKKNLLNKVPLLVAPTKRKVEKVASVLKVSFQKKSNVAPVVVMLLLH